MKRNVLMKAHMETVREVMVGWNVKYEVDVVHEGLGVKQLVKATDKMLLLERAESKMDVLDNRWRKLLKEQDQKEKASLAEERTIEAQNQLDSMERILSECSLSGPVPEFNTLFKKKVFNKDKPVKPEYPPEPEELGWPSEPEESQFKTKSGCGCLTLFVNTKKQDEEKYEAAYREWKQNVVNIKKENKKRKSSYKNKCAKIDRSYTSKIDEWKKEKNLFVGKIEEHKRSARKLLDGYRKNQGKAIGNLFKFILNNYELPPWIPRSHRTLFNPENGILVIEGLLPNQDKMPTLKSVRYVKTSGEFVEKHIANLTQNTLYDTVIYKIVLRSICEVFRWDTNKLIKAVVYNGSIEGVDKATGKKINPCILSIQASREEFKDLNLELVDPKSCFKRLRGTSSSKLFMLTPVAPVLRIDRGDRRFVEGRQVVDGISRGDNLAAMDWEDFEHLIRELFEKEFAESGGEVKVTQASRDGGVDAIIFDPDPIRGGKIVVQAKRYTNTVGVSAVRDLYGTLMNEGANKGILVSTSDYGPDAYKFAKGKPIVLLNGGELLYLLEKHGHKARIDIKEAKTLLAEQERQEKKGRNRTKGRKR
jgi:restriction system protein